jgi:hypothetical protein
MKKALSRFTTKLYHYKGDIKVDGTNGEMIGDCTGLYGDCTSLSGNCTGLRGDLYECDITDEDRKKGIDIAELVGEKD